MSRRVSHRSVSPLFGLAVASTLGMAARAEDPRHQLSSSSRSCATRASTTWPSSTSTSSAPIPSCRPTSRRARLRGRPNPDRRGRRRRATWSSARSCCEEARTKLEAFVKAHPDRPEARDALVQIAKLLVERGYLAMLQGEDIQDKAKKDAKLAEARALVHPGPRGLRQGRRIAQRGLQGQVPGFIAQGRPPARGARHRLLGPTSTRCSRRGSATTSWPRPSPPAPPNGRSHLDEALDQFEDLYKNYREQMAGLTAQMWQAKCYEEQGQDRRRRSASTSSSWSTPTPGSGVLQRNVGYFYIVALAKRKQYALAADEADAWLEEVQPPRGAAIAGGPGRAARAGQGHRRPDARDRPTPRRSRRPPGPIIDAVSQVVRYASPFKNEALALLKKYKPSAAMKAEEIARLTYQDAMDQADEAIASHEWDRAIVLLQGGRPQGRPRPRGRQGSTWPGTTWPSATT